MNKSNDINDLCAALAKAQMAMEGARKDKTNPHFKSAYADLAAVWEAVRDPLAAAGLAIMQWPRAVEGGVEIETILTHSSGQYISDTLWMPCTQMNAHGIGSAITYGRRYALMAVTGVASIDDDANGATGKKPAGLKDYDRQATIHEAERDGLTTGSTVKPPPRAPAPRVAPAAAPDNAVRRAEWVKAAIDGFKLINDKSVLTEWWKTNADKLAVIEEAMPNEYEKLLVAFDAAIETAAARAA